jgi:hypothetical protein
VNPISDSEEPGALDTESLEALLTRADPTANGRWPELSQLEMAALSARIDEARFRSKRPRERVRSVVAVAIAAIVLGAGIATVELSGSGQARAALQLQRLAADAQPLPAIQPGSYLARSAGVGISHAEIGTVTGTLHYWANDMTMCTQGSFIPPAFTGDGAHLWSQLGLPPAPVVNLAGSCRAVALTPYDQAHPNSHIGSGVGALNVSSLTSDPSVLASQLTAGDTGISGLDGVTGPEGSNPGLSRSIVLLTVPLLGAPSDFPSTILRAISQMTNVRSLGTESTHTGAAGDAFASGEGSQQVTVIFDPSDSSMIEAQNPPQMAGLWLLPELQAFTGGSNLPSTLLHANQGEFTPSLEWIDPTGQTASVPATQLPQLPTIPYL